MSILVNASTKVITQGMTGETGTQALARGLEVAGESNRRLRAEMGDVE